MKVSIVSIILLISISVSAQKTIKVKREDNRFLFFQLGQKTDTIIKNKSDLFLIKLPNSLINRVEIYLKNGQFIKTENDSIFRLRPIAGMKYSHTKADTLFTTLLEGNCNAEKTIYIDIINTNTQRIILSNKFMVK